jgi:hypothetical protein
LVESLSLEVKWERVNIPFSDMVLSFPKGREPYGMACVFISQTQKGLFVFHQPASDQMTGGSVGFFHDGVDETVQQTFERVYPSDGVVPNEDDSITAERMRFITQLAAFIGVLTPNSRASLVSEIVLSNDRSKYDSSADEQFRQRLIETAARLNGRGFDFGRQQQERHDKTGRSPHKRKGHWHRYWVGTGRQELSVKWVEEINVLIDKLVEVPTGMLGPETADEMSAATAAFPRVPISLRQRFVILRRDGYRCQLCNRGATHGVDLEIDHKLPVSRGGTNDEDNLWVLCFDCNRGRSNLPL